jgi:protein-tyrosine phosphatase
MEMAQFGDTEVDAAEIKPTWQSLAENGGKKLELEFARLANIVDDRKPLAVGTNEQNRVKNQSDTVIPFDRNRVILTPDGQRPDSTYINASFIEGYHNDESFIITQVHYFETSKKNCSNVYFSP